MNPFVKSVLGLVAAAAIVVATVVGYRWWTERYVVESDDGGLAVARVVAGRLYGGNELRVSRLAGTVQATGSTSRLWGWLKSSRVVKAPYEVDYYVDLRGLEPSDFRYDAKARALLVEVPDVTVGRPNVDEANVTVDRTTGAFVSRDAMAELQRRVSTTATQVVSEEARTPQNIGRAREYGRSALEQLFGGTLAAAGLPVTVTVRFADETRPRSAEQWDVSRSLAEVLGNGA